MSIEKLVEQAAEKLRESGCTVLTSYEDDSTAYKLFVSRGGESRTLKFTLGGSETDAITSIRAALAELQASELDRVMPQPAPVVVEVAAQSPDVTPAASPEPTQPTPVTAS